MGGCEAALDRTLTALAEPHRRHAIDPSRERSRRTGGLTKIIGLSPSAALSDRQLPEWSTPSCQTLGPRTPTVVYADRIREMA